MTSPQPEDYLAKRARAKLNRQAWRKKRLKNLAERAATVGITFELMQDDNVALCRLKSSEGGESTFAVYWCLANGYTRFPGPNQPWSSGERINDCGGIAFMLSQLAKGPYR